MSKTYENGNSCPGSEIPFLWASNFLYWNRRSILSLFYMIDYDALRMQIQNELERRENNARHSFNWEEKARPSQRVPGGDWRFWLILAGRGFGKTQTGSATINAWVHAKRYRNIAIIAQTLVEARHVMIEGVSGILNTSTHPHDPTFLPSKRMLTWKNGAKALLFAGDKPQKLRGPQFDCAWVDELCKFQKPRELWDQLMLCLRLGSSPKCIITTTPRPLPLLKEIMSHPKTHVTVGSTFENEENLSQEFLDDIKNRYGDTALGRQELYAHILEQETRSLFKKEHIVYETVPPSQKVLNVIGIDPAVSTNPNSDETGIIVASLLNDGRAVVSADLSTKAPSKEWAKTVADAYNVLRIHWIVVETNQGGDLIMHALHAINPNILIKKRHVRMDKRTRLEPIVGLYEQKRVIHEKPLPLLEAQMCKELTHQSSPDRMDALAHALDELFFHHKQKPLSIWSC